MANTEDDEYLPHIEDLVQITAEYVIDHAEKTSKTVKLTNLLCTLGSDIYGKVRYGTGRKIITGKVDFYAA